ncbi:MAG: hypothetical protein BRD49_04390, partial [Bacteroidetes bacterium SW_10_40_5]
MPNRVKAGTNGPLFYNEIEFNHLPKELFKKLKSMAYKISMCLLFLLIANYTQAQEVFVNSKDGKPIESVTIFTPDKTTSALTNENGRASLRSFSFSDSLVFRHPSFKTLRTAYVKLRANNFEVSLSEQVLDYQEIVVSASKWEQDI